MFLTRSLTGALHFITRMNSDLYKMYVKLMIRSEISQLLSFFIPVNKVSLNFLLWNFCSHLCSFS